MVACSLSLTYTFFFFFFNEPAPTEISTLPLHDALPILRPPGDGPDAFRRPPHPALLRPLHERDLGEPRGLGLEAGEASRAARHDGLEGRAARARERAGGARRGPARGGGRPRPGALGRGRSGARQRPRR